MPLLEAKKGLKMLKEAGMEKVNFSGGEPFITQNGHYLGELVRYCKEELHLPSVSIVSNGSLIREKWFRDYGEFLDILAISCDSFDEETNREIGRGQGNRNHVQKLLKIHDWCREYHVAFKINTVVNTKNVDEDMAENIMSLNPIRWKHFYLWGHMKYVGYATPVNDINDLEQRSITGRRYLRVASAVRGEAAHDGHFEHSYRVTNVFQCLLLEGENVGKDALRHAEQFYISDDQFQVFLDRHKHVPMLVSESNTKMQNSYLILDEYMRFLDCREGAKRPSPSLLDVGVANALDKSGFDEVMFRKRGGEYKWSKADMLLDW